MDTVRYFAFGANMATATMRRRGVPYQGTEPAVLRDHRLVFDLRGLPLVEPGFASVSAAPGEEVHGVLYTLTPGDLQRLHRTESPSYAHVELDVYTADGQAHRAWVYQTRSPRGAWLPSRRYLGLLIAGAEEHQLPARYRAQLRAHPSRYVPLLSELLRLTVWLAALLRRLLP